MSSNKNDSDDLPPQVPSSPSVPPAPPPPPPPPPPPIKKSTGAKRGVRFAPIDEDEEEGKNDSGKDTSTPKTSDTGKKPEPRQLAPPKITENDLAIGMSNLRSVNRKVKQVILDRAEFFDKHNETKFLPLKPIMKDMILRSKQTTSQITAMNLTGLEQLTDMFFYAMLNRKISFPFLTTMNVSGCHHLTDLGMKWASDNFEKLSMLVVKGCKNMTERSYHYFLDGKQIVKDFQMNSTRVRSASLKLATELDPEVLDLHDDYEERNAAKRSVISEEKILGYFSFRNCPLISPPAEFYLENPKTALLKAEGSLKHLNIFKVVILLEPGQSSVGAMITGKAKTNRGIRIWKNFTKEFWPELNIYEVDMGSGLENLVLNNGGVVIVPFTETKKPDLDRIAGRILSVLSQYPETVFVLANTSETFSNKMDDSPQLVRHKTKDILQKFQKYLTKCSEFGLSDNWVLNEFKFHEQMLFTAGKGMEHSLEMLLEESSPLLSSIHMVTEKENEHAFLVNAIEAVQEKFPWHDFHYLVQTTSAIFLGEYNKERFKGGIGRFSQLVSSVSDEIRYNLNIRVVHQEMKELLGLLDERGMRSFYPDVQHCPCITNSAILEKIANGLIENPPKRKGYIKGLGLNIPCYRKVDLERILAQSIMIDLTLQEVTAKTELFISILEQRGCLLKFACDLSGPGFEETIAYVLTKDLPVTPEVNLGEYWPSDVPNDEIEANKFYTIPLMSSQFMFTLIREYSKMMKFCVLWSTGFIAQQGPVTLFLEMTKKHEEKDFADLGLPTITVAARCQNPPIKNKKSKITDNAGLKDMLWNSFRQITSILDSHLQINKLYASKSVMSKSNVNSTVNEFVLRANKGRGLTTKKMMVKSKTAPVGGSEDSPFGPEQLWDSTEHIPNHCKFDKQYEHNTLEAHNTRFNTTRCFMCGNCVREGIECYGNVDNGKTSRHCGCLLPAFTCKYCGICHFCVQLLSKAWCVTHPSFLNPDMKSMHELNISNIIQTGNIISFSAKETQYKFLVPMSIEYFSHLQICLMRGIQFQFQFYFGEHQIEYNAQSGNIFKASGNAHTKCPPCRMGDYIDIHLVLDEEDLISRKFKLRLNGKTVYQHHLPDKTFIFGIIPLKPGNVMVTSDHLLDISKKTMGQNESSKGKSVVELVIRKAKDLYDADFHGSDEGKYNPFCQVKVENEVVYKTIVKRTNNPTWMSKAVFEVKNYKSLIEVEVFDYDPMGSELLGMTVFNMDSLKELDTAGKKKWFDLQGTANGQISLACKVDTPDDRSVQSEVVQSYSKSVYVHKCSGWLPSVVEQLCAQMTPELEDLFNNRFIDLTGTANVILPNELTPSKVLFPNFQDVKTDLWVHPMCLRRDEGQSHMYTGADDSSSGHWAYHLTNAKGYPVTGFYDTSLTWAWQCIFMHDPKLELPNYDLLFPTLFKSDVEVKMIEKGVQELIKYNATLLFLWRGLNFKLEGMKAMSMLRNQTRVLKDRLEGNVEDSGLVYVPSIYNPSRKILLCPGHISTYQRHQGLTQLPTDGLAEYSKFITFLNLTKNNLVSLPEDIFTILSSLTTVVVSMNLLESIPESIGDCSRLGVLSLDENNLMDLPQSLVNCRNLTRLNISRNTMDEVPSVVTRCTSIEVLMMSDMMLSHLPDDIGNMSNLEMLYANGNCFTKLPDSFCMLQRLTDLSLRGVIWLVSSPAQIMSKERFETLLVSHGLARWLDAHNEDKEELFKLFDEDANGVLDKMEIGKLNATIFNIFPRFGYKGKEHPDDETPSGFPEQILQLSSLRYLNLTYQGIVHIPPEISQLTCLQNLMVSYNPNLLSIAAEVGNLPLSTLELAECTLLKTPPKEIRERGFVTTFAYLRRLLSGSVECHRTKLMLVGLGEAGKTSLVRALQTSNMKGCLTGTESITDGIDITKWDVEYDNEKISYSVWDFAGQTVYYNTHQFFLSNRAVYFLVWNVRLGHEHAGLNFWLSSISVHAPKAPIFIVGTHIDQVSKVELPMDELRATYSQIVDFFFISSYTGQGLKELKEKLFHATLQEDYMGEHIPGAWLELEKLIIRTKSKQKRDTLEYHEVEKTAGEAGIVDKTEIAQAVQFLHDLGALQHFSMNEYLKSRVVINPQWIVDVMACVVSVKQSAIQNGRLHHTDLHEIWKQYPKNMHQWMLRLTEEFDLTFRLPNEEIMVNIVPCLLQEIKPEFHWPELHKHDGIYETKMIYKFDYLPAGLFNRGQVRLQEYSDDSVMWKRGSFLKKNGHIALIQQNRDVEMVVKVQGPIPENIMFHVHEVFEGLIMESYQGVHYDYSVPCPDCLKHTLKDPHMFYASTVRRAIELKAPFLQCMKYFHTIAVVDLQAVMPPTSNNDFDVHIQKAVSGLQDLRRSMKIDLFLSYCESDAPEDRSKVIHPADVYQDLKDVGYSCWFPESTNKYSTDLMARALMDSSVFVVFISSNYVNDPTCTDIFKYAKLTLGKPVVVIVVGEENFTWRKSNIGLLLPDVSFVNMINSKKSVYNLKLGELLTKLEELMNTAINAKKENSPECFISYCWKNSAQAVKLGTRAEAASLGFGDPRDIKEYLENKGVKCWIDVERVGMNGLFDEIAKGLLEAKIMVACVSDEYVQSPSCKKEFHYASTVLGLPIIVCVVGTGNSWRRSEVGILSVNCPVISFQLESTVVFEKLLEMVIETLGASSEENEDSNKPKKENDTEDKTKENFQELYELAQRKFHRQITNYASSQELEPYPRLFVVDIIKQEESEQENTDIDKVEGDDFPEKDVEIVNTGFAMRRFCIHILCECEEGWHSVCEPMVLPEDFGSNYLEKYAPYLSRLTAIMKHSKDMLLNCMTDTDGKNYIKWLFESTEAVVPDFVSEYHDFRNLVFGLDIKKTYGGLSRCRLSSGKTTWLCPRHAQRMNVTVLANMTATIQTKKTTDVGINYTVDWLRKLDSDVLAKKFKSSTKAKRKFHEYEPKVRNSAKDGDKRKLLNEIKSSGGKPKGKNSEKDDGTENNTTNEKSAPKRTESLTSPTGSSRPTSSNSSIWSGGAKKRRPTSQACSMM